MDSGKSSVINQIDRDFLINNLTDELPDLRARMGIKQEELRDIWGIGRQKYSVKETKKEKNDMKYVYFFIYIFYAK